MDLNQTDWKNQLTEDNDAVILDVRTPEEWELGIIPNALKSNLYEGENFIKEIEALDRAKSYYIYCRSGRRSEQACAVMQQMGFSKTYNLLGGILEYDGNLV